MTLLSTDFFGFAERGPRILSLGVLLALAGVANAQAPTVTTLSPARNARLAPRTTDVAVGFSQVLAPNAATLGSLKVFSQQSGGRKAGTATVSGSTLAFNPSTDFKAGETVFATVTSAAQSTSGAAVTPQVFQFTTAVTPSSGAFTNKQEVPVGIQPADIATGDIDGDGDPDLLTPDFTSNTISVRRNDGTGSFSGSQTVAITSPSRVALGDVDGDGDLDLAAGSSTNTGQTVLVRFNDGAGNFSGNQAVAVGGTADLTLRDVDEDGDLDLLAVNNRDKVVSVRLNSGLGVFSGNQEVAVGNQPVGLAMADVDGDGDLDLLTANFGDASIGIRLNNGLGTFSGTYYVTMGSAPIRVTTADVDGDGDLDIITANGNGVSPSFARNVSMQLNDGNGLFSPAPDLSVNGYTYDVAAADVEGDGDLDLLMAYSTGVSIRLNNGAGSFSGNQNVPVGTGPQKVAAVDLDGDGDLDLLTPNAFSNNVSVRLNQNALPGTPVLITSVLPAQNARSAARTTDVAVSVNRALSNTAATQQALRVFSQQAGGRKAGVATVSGSTLAFNPGTDFKAGETVFATAKSYILTTDNFPLLTPHVFQFTTATSPSAGRFNPGPDAPVGGPNGSPYQVVTGDVDGDGDLDLLTANLSSGTVSIRLNNGLGSFSGNQEVAVGASPLTLALGDFDSDGDLDFATANGLSTASPGTVSVRLNSGLGSFAAGQELTTGVRFNGAGNGLAVGDMDGDGDLDLVTTYLLGPTSATGVTSVLINSGDGIFVRGAELVTTSPFPTAVAVGDVDNDGDLDLFTANDVNVSVRLNNGLGTFVGNEQVAVGTAPTDLAVGDLDGDGDLDFVTANSGLSSSVSIRLNSGSGRFSGTQNLALPSAPYGVALGDVDGDGDLDLVAVRRSDSGADVYLNNGSGAFTTSQLVFVDRSPEGVALGDVDGDGTLDLLTANYVGQTVSIRLNKTVLANAPAQLAEQVSLYPNPAHASVRLRLPAELAKQPLQVSVLNNLGQTVVTQTLRAQSSLDLPLPALAVGVYTLHLRTNLGLVTKRLLIN